MTIPTAVSRKINVEEMTSVADKKINARGTMSVADKKINVEGTTKVAAKKINGVGTKNNVGRTTIGVDKKLTIFAAKKRHANKLISAINPLPKHNKNVRVMTVFAMIANVRIEQHKREMPGVGKQLISVLPKMRVIISIKK